jgi:benzoylformate decarboxylase
VKASNAFLETLLRWDIDFIFGCPGNTEVPLLDALVDRTRPKFLVTTLESIAVAMADGYSRVTGKPGLLCCIPMWDLLTELVKFTMPT